MGPGSNTRCSFGRNFPIPSWGALPLPTPHHPPMNLHMLDFRELELLGEEGGVW